MPPKKQQRNGFWYFMLDYKKRHEHSSPNAFPRGFKDVQNDPKCSREWQNLPSEEKKRYNDMAKGYKGKDTKLTSWGEPINDVLERKRKAEAFEIEMRVVIGNLVEVAQTSKNVPDLTFYVIHVNYFYSRDKPDTSTDYIPAEMAICEFSLAEGIKRTLHQLINVNVEIGFARETMEHSDSTHKIPTDHADGEGNYVKIYEKFRSFLKPTEDITGKIPIIYTRKKFSTIVSCFLDRMTAAAGVTQDTFTLYSLDCLFGKLMTLCNVIPDRHCNPIILAETELEKDYFSYSPNIECVYHAKIEGASIHCSLAIIRQWCFAICDYCCNFFGVEMIPDAHCPAASITSDVDVLAININTLNLDKKFIPSTLKSMTGVSEAYRLEKSGRTAKQEALRRKAALLKPLEIIVHSQNEPTTITSPATPSPPPPAKPAPVTETGDSVKFTKPLRPPKTCQLPPEVDDSVPRFNDSNFPMLGNYGRGSLRARILSKNMEPPLSGRGRGGIALD